MKKILITQNIKDMAASYLTDVKAMDNKPEDRLQLLVGQLRGDAAAYVQKIIDNDDIITATPNDVENNIKSLFGVVDRNLLDESCDIIYQKKDGPVTVTKALYKHIVDALGYDDIQEKVFPKYARQLGIRTCVYCHAQYAVSSKKGKTNRGGRYRPTFNLDHNQPKSDFPFLAASFFNLYPCCPTCNQAKSYKASIFDLYEEDESKLIPFKFVLDKKSFLDYSMTGDSNSLKIALAPNAGFGDDDVKKYDQYFHINKLYANFNDTVEEVIWKYRAYNTSYYKALVQSGIKSIPNQSCLNRFVFGNYDEPKDMLKRPLAKLVQDIAKQLGILK